MFKKMIISIGIILVVFLVYFIIKARPKSISLTIIPSAHSFVTLTDEEEVMDFNIIINQKSSYITDINRIKDAYISDIDESNLYPINISTIKNINDHLINNTYYYDYQFTFTSRSIEEEFVLSQAYLIIEYDVSRLKVFIGSFSSYKVDSFNSSDLRINYLKGIVNPYQDKKLLVGIIFGFKNESKSDLIIENIKPLNYMVTINNYEVFNNQVNSSTNINEVVNHNYEISNYNQAIINQEIDDDINLLCTIGYLDYYEIDTLAFKIDYRLNSRLETMYFSPFTFYENFEQYIDIKDLTFYKVPND